MSAGLTKEQDRCLAFIRQSIADGLSPSFAEIGQALGIASKSGVHRLVHSLQYRGYIDFLAARARSIVLADSCAGVPFELMTSDALLAVSQKITGILAARRAVAA